MFRLLTQWNGFANLDDKHAKLTRNGLQGIWVIAILAAFFIIVLAISDNLYAKSFSDDRDGDDISDAEEDRIARVWVPQILGNKSDDCLPLQYDGGWCEKYDHSPGREYEEDKHHQIGYIGYDVVDVGFSDLVAIEYTLFLDYQCKDNWLIPPFWKRNTHHFFENEGFTMLLRKCPSCPSDYELLSIITIEHHKRNPFENSDRLYPHEVQGWIDGGKKLFCAENTHAIYVHWYVCEYVIWDQENCAGKPEHQVLLNALSHFGPYDTRPCPTQENIDSLTKYSHIPDCWSKRLHLLGSSRFPGASPCSSWDDPVTELHVRRKRLPPWVPVEVGFPGNLAYVDLFLEKNFEAGDRQGDCERINFGDALVNAQMPMRLIGFTDAAWWREYYDPQYQVKAKDDGVRMLAHEAFRYFYWNEDCIRDKVDYWEQIESLILRGLPGTVLALYDYEGGSENGTGYERRAILIMPEGQRVLAVRDLDSLPDLDPQKDHMINDLEFITWGFGPLADASGNDTTVECRDTVILDASRSFRYIPETEILHNTFHFANVNPNSTIDSQIEKLWEFNWFDESDGDKHLGGGYRLETDKLNVGQHPIRLEVSGTRVPWPDSMHVDVIRYPAVVRDWCTVVVTIGAPVGVINGIVADSTGGRHGITVSAINLDSINSPPRPSIFDFACTDENGFYEFDSMAPGDYEVSIVTPLGFLCEEESKYDSIAYSCWPPPITLDFEIMPFFITPSPRTMGFWKHQVNTHLEGKGKPHITLAELSDYMNLIRIHFNQNCANPVSIFQVPQPANQTDSLEILQELLTVNKDGTMNDRAKQQLIALMLNVASLKLHQTYPISEDSATVSQAITFCNQLITDANESNDELAKDIAENINKGMMVAAGVIPLTSPDIIYKEAGDQTVSTKAIPNEFSLSQNYPNPFNPVTEISFSLPKASDVRLEIFNIKGQRVATLFSGQLRAGYHTVPWDGSDFASGVYLYRLQADSFTDTKKMVLMK